MIEAFTLPLYNNLVLKKKSHEVVTREGRPVEILRTKMRNQHHPVITIVTFDTCEELIRYGKKKDGSYGTWLHVPSLDLFLRPVGSQELPEQIKDKRKENFGY